MGEWIDETRLEKFISSSAFLPINSYLPFDKKICDAQEKQ